MERLNLNIPADARKDLKQLASKSRVREGVLARELLLHAIARAKRDEFFRHAAEAQSPALTKRQLKIARALERMRG
jgi:hypothetical protein